MPLIRTCLVSMRDIYAPWADYNPPLHLFFVRPCAREAGESRGDCVTAGAFREVRFSEHAHRHEAVEDHGHRTVEHEPGEECRLRAGPEARSHRGVVEHEQNAVDEVDNEPGRGVTEVGG